MARPKKDEAEKKKHVAHFRLTDAEYAVFQDLSDSSGLTKAQLARAASRGIKQIAVSEDLVSEARQISYHCAQIGNLLRLHATLLEVIDQHPALNSQDRKEISIIRILLSEDKKQISDLKKQVIDLRHEIGALKNGDI